MRRGTTPTITLNIPEINLADLKEIWVTFTQPSAFSKKTLTKRKNDSGVQIVGNTINVTLTQQETLQFFAGFCRVQLRGLSLTGEAFATDIVEMPVEEILSDGVIE